MLWFLLKEVLQTTLNSCLYINHTHLHRHHSHLVISKFFQVFFSFPHIIAFHLLGNNDVGSHPMELVAKDFGAAQTHQEDTNYAPDPGKPRCMTQCFQFFYLYIIVCESCDVHYV